MSIISSFNILLVLMILAQTSQTYNNREMAGLYVGKTLWYQTSTELVLYPNGDYLFRKDNITSEGKWKVENQGVILTPFNGEKIRIHQFEYESISFEIITRKKMHCSWENVHIPRKNPDNAVFIILMPEYLIKKD